MKVISMDIMKWKMNKMNERITYDGICKYCGATKQTKIHYTNATTIFCKQCDIEYRTKGEKTSWEKHKYRRYKEMNERYKKHKGMKKNKRNGICI